MKPIKKFVKVNSRTWVEVDINIPDAEVIRKFEKQERKADIYPDKKFNQKFAKKRPH